MRYVGYVIGVIWSMLHTLFGLLLVLIYWPRSIRWRKGCIEMVATRIIGFKKPASGAQTHGIIIYGTDLAALNNIPLGVHERKHVIQGFVLGPFYPIAYVLHFLVLYVKVKAGWTDGIGTGAAWKRAYRMIVFERQARRAEIAYESGNAPDAWGS